MEAAAAVTEVAAWADTAEAREAVDISAVSLAETTLAEGQSAEAMREQVIPPEATLAVDTSEAGTWEARHITAVEVIWAAACPAEGTSAEATWVAATVEAPRITAAELIWAAVLSVEDMLAAMLAGTWAVEHITAVGT